MKAFRITMINDPYLFIKMKQIEPKERLIYKQIYDKKRLHHSHSLKLEVDN